MRQCWHQPAKKKGSDHRYSGEGGPGTQPSPPRRHSRLPRGPQLSAETSSQGSVETLQTALPRTASNEGMRTTGLGSNSFGACVSLRGSWLQLPRGEVIWSTFSHITWQHPTGRRHDNKRVDEKKLTWLRLRGAGLRQATRGGSTRTGHSWESQCKAGHEVLHVSSRAEADQTCMQAPRYSPLQQITCRLGNVAHRCVSCILPRQGSEDCTGASASGGSNHIAQESWDSCRRNMYGTRDAASQWEIRLSDPSEVVRVQLGADIRCSSTRATHGNIPCTGALSGTLGQGSER